MSRDDSPSSFEAYARQLRRYHPVLFEQVRALYRADPRFVSGLFSNARDLGLFISALKHARVHVLQAGRISSGRRAPGLRKDSCLEYYRRFPKTFAGFFSGRRSMVAFLAECLGRWKAASTTPLSRSLGSARTGATPCFMLGNHSIWASNVLNKPGRRLGNTFDLATVEGFVYLLHEVFHVMQWYRSPWRLLFQYLKAVVKSIAISDGHIPWAHEVIDFEVEAITFQQRLRFHLEQLEKQEKEFLTVFKNHR